MQAGPKRLPPSEKRARGTYQPCRDAHVVEIADGEGMPSTPDWLTTEGQEVWMDDMGRVSPGRLVTERDSTMFATYCNLQGAIIKAWRIGEVPPASHLMEARKMAEQFGIFGAKSRLKTADPADANRSPFARNGVRRA